MYNELSEVKNKSKLLSLDTLVNMFKTICINRIIVLSIDRLEQCIFACLHVSQFTPEKPKHAFSQFLSVMLADVFFCAIHRTFRALFVMKLSLYSIHALECYMLLGTVICIQKCNWRQWVLEEGRSVVWQCLGMRGIGDRGRGR